MTSKDFHYTPVTIRKFQGFYELYADSGIVTPEAPNTEKDKKFTEASALLDASTVRQYDRDRSGGFVSG